MKTENMLNKTIAKFLRFVISSAAICTIFSACSSDLSGNRRIPAGSNYLPPKITGKIRSPDVTESSGVIASKCQPGVLWTHNDSGDDAFIFAFNAAGDDLGTWRIPNGHNNDWEDIADFKDSSGKCFIYAGDIGDNNEKRSDHAIYRIPEPEVPRNATHSSRKDPHFTENAAILQFNYPDSKHNAETLMVHPRTGDIYVVTKRIDGPAGVYRLKPVFDSGATQTAAKIAELAVPSIPNGLLTGGDISPDGKRMIICDYTAAFEYTLPESAANFDEIWKQKPQVIDIGNRQQGEGICYSPDGNSLFATSEGKNSPVIKIDRKP